MERKGATTFQGNPLTLIGQELKVGSVMPDCTVIDNNLNSFHLSEMKGKNCIILSVPSLDTSVCDMETRRFNEEAAKLKNVEILCISMDLPFSQKNWCGAHGIDKVKTLSDHREASFGQAFGVLIKELRLLARSVFVFDSKGSLRYVQLVKEMTQLPQFDEVIKEAQRL